VIETIQREFFAWKESFKLFYATLATLNLFDNAERHRHDSSHVGSAELRSSLMIKPTGARLLRVCVGRPVGLSIKLRM
jgi:hypothetical protein